MKKKTRKARHCVTPSVLLGVEQLEDRWVPAGNLVGTTTPLLGFTAVGDPIFTDNLSRVAASPDGVFLLGGDTRGNPQDTGVANGGVDGFLELRDASGNVLTQFISGLPGADTVTDVEFSAAGSQFIAGISDTSPFAASKASTLIAFDQLGNAEMERRYASRQKRENKEEVDAAEVNADETSLSAVFDRAWAKAIMQQAVRRQKERAEESGEEALRRVELLRLRFQEDVPIRDVAQQRQVDADHLHREYAKGRKEFHQALKEVVAEHHPGAVDEIERECRELLSLLQ